VPVSENYANEGNIRQRNPIELWQPMNAVTVK
jgi:hypothetical protein